MYQEPLWEQSSSTWDGTKNFTNWLHARYTNINSPGSRVSSAIEWEPSQETRERMQVACRALRTSYAEFVDFAVRQALDEAEALGREQKAIKEYYERNTV